MPDLKQSMAGKLFLLDWHLFSLGSDLSHKSNMEGKTQLYGLPVCRPVLIQLWMGRG